MHIVGVDAGNMIAEAAHPRRALRAPARAQRFAQHEGVLYVGKAQEKARVMRTERRRSRFTGGTYPWIASLALAGGVIVSGLATRRAGCSFNLAQQ
jgi:hypothetical protein